MTKIPHKSTISGANKRKPTEVLGRYTPHYTINVKVFFDRYSRNKRSALSWLKKLKIMNSAIISPFSNLIYKGFRRDSNKGKKMEEKVHTITYADIQKKNLIHLLTNDFEMPQENIIDIYLKRG